MNRMRHVMMAGACTLFVAACAEPKDPVPPEADAPVVPSADPESAASLAQRWLGRWQGPEGTWLEIAVANGTYVVIVANLDGPRQFAAVAGPDGLSFERDGVRETLRATDGPGTGMKWLDTQADCLVIRTGEGFCRR